MLSRKVNSLDIQKLYVRLYFCDDLVEHYKLDSCELLARLGVSDSAISILPDVNSEAFLVESHGRRMNVAGELLSRYRPFFSAINNKKISSPNELLNLAIFNDFIQSEYFFEAKRSLLHPYGLGFGYECISKFYFFCANRSDIFNKLLICLKKCLALYIIYSSKHSSIDAYKNIENGVFIQDDAAKITHIINRESTINSISYKTYKELYALGLHSFDTLLSDLSC